MDVIEKLQIITNNINTILPVLKNAGVDHKIQAVVVKHIYKEVGIDLPFEIPAEEHYYGVEDIAKELEMFTKSGKPAINAVKTIIDSIKIPESEKQIVWESNGSWQGTVEKYTSKAIDRVKDWLIKHKYPSKVVHTTSNNKRMKYSIFYGLNRTKVKAENNDKEGTRQLSLDDI